MAEDSWFSNTMEDSGTSPFPLASLIGLAVCTLVCHLMVPKYRLYTFTQAHESI